MVHLHVAAVLCIAFGSISVNSVKFPESIIKRCHAGDTDCLAKTMTKVLQEHYSGIPELGMPTLDPCHFGSSSLSQAAGGPVTLNLTVIDGNLIGWRNMVVTQVIGFEKDPRTSKFELNVEVPLDILSSKYELMGRLLLVPLQGSGNLNIRHENLRMNVKFTMKVVTLNNEDFIKLKKTECDIHAQRVTYKFDNLFNNKEISDGLNDALNTNSQLIFDATRVGFGRSRSEAITNILGPIFTKFPYKDFFADE